jgi:NAD(P)-dependent dehydrogenase (short-subunit alcohol dehydrogenase family)
MQVSVKGRRALVTGGNTGIGASIADSCLTGSTVYADGAMTDYPDFAHGG